MTDQGKKDLEYLYEVVMTNTTGIHGCWKMMVNHLRAIETAMRTFRKSNGYGKEENLSTDKEK